MGVFNKTPYTNFHELNLNWIIKKIKEVAADNTYFKQFFKTIEDEHILGVVTKVTENTNNTVKTDYLNESTQQMDNYVAYNKTGTDGAISGAVTPIANRVTTAEGNINALTQTAMYRNVDLGTTKIIDFIHDTNNSIGHYMLKAQNSPDNPAGQGNTCTVILHKTQLSGAYSYLMAFRPGRVWVCYSSITVNTQNLYWYEMANKDEVTTLDHVRVYSNTENATTFTITGLQNITQNRFRFGLLYCADTSKASVYIMTLQGGQTTGDLVFIPITNNYRSFTGSFESGVLTLTANNIVYGGIRVLWID